MGNVDIVICEQNQLWIDSMVSSAVVPDLAWKRDDIAYALDVQTHTAISTAARSSRIASADNLKKNGKGTIEARNNARIAADAATAEATAAKAAYASNYHELAANAAKKACRLLHCRLHRWLRYHRCCLW